jgi:hypothetical protein
MIRTAVAHLRAQWAGFLALFLVVAGGTAYAANTVFSSDIVNGEVKAADIATGAVHTSEIGDNQVRSADVKELDGFFEATAAGGNCGADSGTPAECLSARITLERPGKLLVNMTSSWHTFALDTGLPGDDPTLVRGRCWLTVDGTQIGDKQAAGEKSSNGVPAHPVDAPGALAITALSGPLPAGSHIAELFCTQEDGDLDWQNINLTAALVAG